jgi:hypothetical protein
MSPERLSVRNISGHTFTLDEAAGTITVTDDSGDEIAFNALSRTLSVNVKGGVTVRVTEGTVTIEGSAAVSLSSPGRVSISGVTGVDIGGAEVLIGGSGCLPLANEALLDLFNGHTHTVTTTGGTFTTGSPLSTAVKGTHSTRVTRGS